MRVILNSKVFLEKTFSVLSSAIECRSIQVETSIRLTGLAGFGNGWFTRSVSIPYKVATLLYCFNEQDEVLLMERAREPNLGLWSPPGGKLRQEIGESPGVCACREAWEELAIEIDPPDLHLTGLISERGYSGQAHWLMFLYEVRRRVIRLPAPIGEGRFDFFRQEAIGELLLPQTDREQIWPLFWRHRGGFFSAHCHCHGGGRNEWTVEQSAPVAVAAADG